MKPVVLCILDGVGIKETEIGNAFKQASTPNFDNLWNNFPHSLLQASGEAVGLPANQMGNSEVGHMNIGAGRIVKQPLKIINESIEENNLANKEELINTINHVKNNNSKLHILGLLSDGGVHSHIDHILKLLEISKEQSLNKVYLHIFLDGRDTLPKSALKYIKILEDKIQKLQTGIITTVCGRYYAMDRDNRWDRTEKAYNTIVNGIGEEETDLNSLINKSYENNVTDEFIIPTVINKEGTIESNDGIIVGNFRPDRLTQLLTSITNENFKDFNTKSLTNIKLVTMFPCEKSVISQPIFKTEKLENTIGEYISNLGYSQLRIAETEKYDHVTYFFDGGIEKELESCKKILIPSPKVKTYDLKPEMSCEELTDSLLKELTENKNYDLIVLNYANGDMVGHTGNIETTKKAIETVDYNLGKLFKKIQEVKGTLIITADHGNCEEMLNAKNETLTSHSRNPVPFIICNNKYKVNSGKLADIAPTILTILNIEVPKEMTGNILINK